ncbi:hypothetical protein [Domibacillus epiphyticus]|uniref:Uncharacterized protein n=1 Tax=Domibacillus epiphyticus TaxID=1714355 RepID=A0A1V2A7I8_9BACI|nr:hypothetical protein [Domibacillus epiphyticus]OMP66958.1 hypothetical protein BTO28_09480 [Domibacillus epiphyticus]
MIEHKNLSLHVSKEQLKSMVHEMSQKHYLIFWGFDRGTMILNVYHAKANNQFTFIRHKDTMEMIYAKVIDEDILLLLNSTIRFASRTQENKTKTVMLTKEMQYKEIDYFLSVLHEYMEERNEQKIAETKAILKELTSNAS